MAFEFISVERIMRKSEQEPHGYNLEINYNGKRIFCKLYTEAFFNNIGNELIVCNRFNYQPLNGDFNFRVEMPYTLKNLEKELEKEIRKKTRTLKI